MAQITSVIFGSYIATPGVGTRTLSLPPGRIGMFSTQYPASSADAGNITFGTQFPDVEGWTGTNLYHMEYDSASEADIVVKYWLLVSDVAVPRIVYGGA